mmetsp:Transcript_2622/g.6198  ORF Transcript_2622/g.6198 Transcript_2622/m.6198 type:complete len:384 (+) Transcript_2622:145-1296(+)
METVQVLVAANLLAGLVLRAGERLPQAEPRLLPLVRLLHPLPLHIVGRLESELHRLRGSVVVDADQRNEGVEHEKGPRLAAEGALAKDAHHHLHAAVKHRRDRRGEIEDVADLCRLLECHRVHGCGHHVAGDTEPHSGEVGGLLDPREDLPAKRDAHRVGVLRHHVLSHVRECVSGGDLDPGHIRFGDRARHRCVGNPHLPVARRGQRLRPPPVRRLGLRQALLPPLACLRQGRRLLRRRGHELRQRLWVRVVGAPEALEGDKGEERVAAQLPPPCAGVLLVDADADLHRRGERAVHHPFEDDDAVHPQRAHEVDGVHARRDDGAARSDGRREAGAEVDPAQDLPAEASPELVAVQRKADLLHQHLRRCHGELARGLGLGLWA